MGANEKHAATYHGGEYTPSLEEIRRHWGLAVDTHRREERLAEFDRMITEVRAEAKAEALNEVANAFQYKAWNELIQGRLQDRLRVAQPITAWLRARANQYKENQ